MTLMLGHRKVRAIDFIGIVLALAGAVGVMLGLTWGGGEYQWNSPGVLVSIIVGAFVCACFVLWQWKGPKFPLVPCTNLLSLRNFAHNY